MDDWCFGKYLKHACHHKEGITSLQATWGREGEFAAGLQENGCHLLLVTG